MKAFNLYYASFLFRQGTLGKHACAVADEVQVGTDRVDWEPLGFQNPVHAACQILNAVKQGPVQIKYNRLGFHPGYNKDFREVP